MYVNFSLLSFPFLSSFNCAVQLMRLQADGQMKDGKWEWHIYFWSCGITASMKNDVPAWIIKELQSSTDQPVHRSIDNIQTERAICSKVARAATHLREDASVISGEDLCSTKCFKDTGYCFQQGESDWLAEHNLVWPAEVMNFFDLNTTSSIIRTIL